MAAVHPNTFCGVLQDLLYCLFYRDCRISHVPVPPREVRVACPRESTAVLDGTSHRVWPLSGSPRKANTIKPAGVVEKGDDSERVK